MIDFIMYGIVLIYGLLIGSFLNVCIYRIPEKSSVVFKRSHCMNCNYQLKWYDMIPVFSYLFLQGKCRKCKTKISIQYPMIEALNGILYVLVFYRNGWESVHTILLNVISCFVISALIVISVIDSRTNIIPFGINIFIMVMGVAAALVKYFGLGRDTGILFEHAIGFVAVSGFLTLLFYATGGRGIGGGDIKLMAAAGLVLGWKLILLAFFLGCIFATVVHPLRMKISKIGKALAFGPYLSAGIVVAMLYGNQMIDWYFKTWLI